VKEFGEWVAYRSKGYKLLGLLPNARVEDGKVPTDIDRIVLRTPDYNEACRRLDKMLKKKPKPKYDSSGQIRIDQ
jgi:hypothetical protein